MQLNEMIRLKANADRKLRQMKVKWKRKLAERARIALKVNIYMSMRCMSILPLVCVV